MRADHYASPEDAMAALQRNRNTKLTLVVAALIAAIVAMISVSALMYSDSDYAKPAQHR